jgi:(p)ppGpp synthase/HD superfamily hydrolase
LPLFSSVEDQISKIYSKDDVEKRLMRILDKKEKFSHFIKSVYPEEVIAQKKVPHSSSSEKKDLQSSENNMVVVVDGDPLINYYFCYECKPKPGEKIIAKV